MIQEVRDRLAGLEGWTKNTAGNWVSFKGVERRTHPIPDDLNTCVAMWHEYAGEHGWSRMCDSDGDWCAFERNGERRYVEVGHSGHDAASELRDRWALLGEVLKARGVW